jgi:L-lactate utilization protein LutC
MKVMEHVGVSKEDFLESVRQALGKQKKGLTGTYYPLQEGLEGLEERAHSLESRLARQRPQLLDKLAEVARARDWNVHRATGVEDALSYISKLIASTNASLVVRSAQDVFGSLDVDNTICQQGAHVTVMSRGWRDPDESMRLEVSQADIGITGVEYAVAETGSVVLLPQQGLSRLTSLFPPIHLAIVRPKEVVETLDDLFLLRRLAYYRGEWSMGGYLNIITGPSRTADIEQKVVVGVHGPRETHMLMLEN